MDAVYGGNNTILRIFRNEDGSAAFTELTGADNPFNTLSLQFSNAARFRRL